MNQLFKKLTSIKLVEIVSICGLLILITGCPAIKKNENVYYHLSDAQKIFINTIPTGDTVIWQSNLGYYDTAIIQPVVIENYFIKSGEGDVYGERAYYKHKFLGVKKSSVSDGVVVFQGESAPAPGLILVSTFWNGNQSIASKGKITSRSFAGIPYSNIYWSPSSNDTVFICDKGYLGYKLGGEILNKIK